MKPDLRYTLGLAAFSCLMALAAPASATELVHTFINPSFGGNPLNGQYLLNNAEAQNKFKDPSAIIPTPQQPSNLQNFNDMLENIILGRLASSVSSSIMDSQGNLHPGTIQTSNFTINITQVNNSTLQVMTTDKTTGQSTTFNVSTGTF